jgi:hypothetical protein
MSSTTCPEHILCTDSLSIAFIEETIYKEQREICIYVYKKRKKKRERDYYYYYWVDFDSRISGVLTVQ